MSTALSGVNANVHVGATDVDASGWSADYETSGFDSTTTADGGWEDETGATLKFSGSFDFFYNPAKKPTGALGIVPRAVVALTLYVDSVGGDNYAGNALIKKLSIKTKTKDGVTVTASFTSKGIWTVPA